jgi:signal transduction histidine kinase
MQIHLFDKWADLDVREINAFYRATPKVAAEYDASTNARNIKNSRVFLYFVILSQIVVGAGRLSRDLGYPYYNAFVIVLCLALLFLSRYPYFQSHFKKLALALFTAWAATFPFFVIRLGGYDSPTYPVYILIIIYILVFFYFSFFEYVFLFAAVFLSNIAIFFLQAHVDIEDFVYRQIVMILVITVGLAASYINVHARRKDFHNQFILQQQKEELQSAYRQLENTELQLIQSEKLASLGKMTAGIAHEINNPLAFLHGNLETIEEYLSDMKNLLKLYDTFQFTSEEQRKAIEAYKRQIQYDLLIGDLSKVIESCEHGAERIAEIVNKLKTFSRLDESDKKTVDIHEGLDATIELFARQNDHIQIKKEYGQLPKLECHPSHLNQVFYSIIENAIDSLRPDADGCIEIKTCQTKSEFRKSNGTTESKDCLQIRISDNGCGIPEEVQRKIFDPFFTTKDVGRGVGLGLSLAYGIIQQHDGMIYCKSRLGQGTDFYVELPIR